MRNSDVAKILREIALLLEMNDIPFKPRAYEKAARTIEGLEEEVAEINRRDGLKGLIKIPGIGQNLANKIRELIKTGQLKYHQELKKKVPVDIEGLSKIEGIGPKTMKILWEKLKIKDIHDLEEAAVTHQICHLPGFKKKTEQNILKGIEFAKQSKGRYILGFTLPVIREIKDRIKVLPEVTEVEVAGSVRRMKETIGDADFLVISDNPQKVMDLFVSMPEVIDIISKGNTKSSIKLSTGMDADLRVLPNEMFGSALQYFTGSKDHNIILRRIAKEKKLKLSEYGLFQGEERIAGRIEEEVYEKLGMQWIPPELREDTGEIEAAGQQKLPRLLEYNDLRGDFQVHSNWTDGVHSIREMMEEAQRIGLEYIVISDHSKYLAMTGGLDEHMLLKQGIEIDKINENNTGVRLLKGVEVNILKDGSVDINEAILGGLDVVGAGVHSHFNMSQDEMTERILTAMDNPYVDILYHPTGRLIQKRRPIQLHIEKILEKAKETGTILDIDSFPNRLDLKDDYIRKAVTIGCKLGVSSDAHNKMHLHYLELGVAQARRGWAKPSDIVNTQNVEDFLKALKY